MRRPRRAATALLVLAAVAPTAACTAEEPVPPRATVAAERGAVELPHEVRVAAEGGCPGYRLFSPVPVEVVSGSASTIVGLAAGGADEPSSSVHLTCLGDLGMPVEDWVAQRERDVGEHLGPLERAVVVPGPYGDALRLTTDLGLTHLTEWYVGGDGYAFAVGHLRADSDDSRLATVEAMLATWQWE